MDWLLENLLKSHDGTAAVGKKKISDRMSQSIASLKDPVEQDHYVIKLAKQIDVSEDSLWQKVKKHTEPALTASEKTAKFRTDALSHGEEKVVEEALLAICITFSDTRTSLDELSEAHFGSEERQAIFAAIKQLGDKAIDGAAKLPKALLPLENYAKVLILKGEEEYRDWAALDRRIEAFSLAHRLQQLEIKHQKQTLSREIKMAEGQGDQRKREELLKQFRDLPR